MPLFPCFFSYLLKTFDYCDDFSGCAEAEYTLRILTYLPGTGQVACVACWRDFPRRVFCVVNDSADTRDHSREVSNHQGESHSGGVYSLAVGSPWPVSGYRHITLAHETLARDWIEVLDGWCNRESNLYNGKKALSDLVGFRE